MDAWGPYSYGEPDDFEPELMDEFNLLMQNEYDRLSEEGDEDRENWDGQAIRY